MKNSLKTTIYATALFLIAAIIFMPFGVIGFILAILYAQIIEWFVHGWIQHHPFKIFSAYRKAHTHHHKYPNEPRSVQPIQYFIIGSIFLLAPFYWFSGFWAGYFFAYIMINIIHDDLHSELKTLPIWLWNTNYFKLIESHHLKHHTSHKKHHSSNSVTNPYLDFIFDKLRVTQLNNFIAKKLKI